MSRWCVACLGVLALVGSACGGGGGGPVPGANRDLAADGAGTGGDPSNRGADRDACELVTAADAERILLEPVTTPESDDEASASGLAVASCNWRVDHPAGFKLLQFSVYSGGQFYGEEQFTTSRGFEAVDGLGDRAFFIDLGGPQLQVLDGDTVLIFAVSSFNVETRPLDDVTVKDGLRDLARTVLARL